MNLKHPTKKRLSVKYEQKPTQKNFFAFFPFFFRPPKFFREKEKNFFWSWLSLERSGNDKSFRLFQTSDLVERKLWFEIIFCSERKI